MANGRQRFTKGRISAALAVAFLTFLLTPLINGHLCSAGSRTFEVILSVALCAAAFFTVLYAPPPRLKGLAVIVWLVIVFGITWIYQEWIHGPYSPWPAKEMPAFTTIVKPDADTPDRANRKPPSFFPIDEEEVTGISRFTNEWYSWQLSALGECPLPPLAGNAAAEIYRFTLLPTWGNPRAVRLARQGNGYVIAYARADGQGGYDPGNLIEHKEVPIQAGKVDEFRALLARSGYFMMAVEGQRGLDGEEWILEAVRNGRYYLAVRWSPDYDEDQRGTRAFVAACKWLLVHAPAWRRWPAPDADGVEEMVDIHFDLLDWVGNPWRWKPF